VLLSKLCNLEALQNMMAALFRPYSTVHLRRLPNNHAALHNIAVLLYMMHQRAYSGNAYCVALVSHWLFFNLSWSRSCAMNEPFRISSGEDFKRRLCVIMHNGCYYLGLLPCQSNIDEGSFRVLPLDLIFLPYALPITAESETDIVKNILEHPVFFLKVALVYNHLSDVRFPDDCKMTWGILPCLLDKYRIMDAIDGVLMDCLGTRKVDYDIAINTQLQCYLYCALEDWKRSRGNEFIPPPLDRVQPEWDYNRVTSAVKREWHTNTFLYHQRAFTQDQSAAPLRPHRLFADHRETVINVLPAPPSPYNPTTNVEQTTLSTTPSLASTASSASTHTPSSASTLDDVFGLPECHLVKIRNKDGKSRYESGYYTKKNCYICRGWYDKPPTTSFECAHCGMPLCNPSRTGVRVGRKVTCLFEHQHSAHNETRCGGAYYKNKKFPSELKRQPLIHFPSHSKNNSE
jgi:hypothetical protein